MSNYYANFDASSPLLFFDVYYCLFTFVNRNNGSHILEMFVLIEKEMLELILCLLYHVSMTAHLV